MRKKTKTVLPNRFFSFAAITKLPFSPSFCGIRKRKRGYRQRVAGLRLLSYEETDRRIMPHLCYGKRQSTGTMNDGDGSPSVL